MKKLLLALTLAAPTTMSAITPLWLRDVKISPDGAKIAFCYKGDIWAVPATGGLATQLTTSDSYESNPIWSPDSKSIAFASDRNGNFDVFVMNADGGSATRLTFNSASEIPEAFTPDGAEVMYSASIQDPACSALFPTGRMTELYTVAVTGGAPRQYLATPARFISWSRDGKSFLYQDVKGFEDEWRKHHTSSVTRDIWRYDVAGARHTNLTARGGEDLNAIDAGDKIYFLSERNGATINVYRADADARNAVAITDFKTHPVRFLSRSDAGMLAFTYDGEIYTMRDSDKAPTKVAIDLTDSYVELPKKLSVTRGASESAASPDGKSVAFIYRGDVFVTSVEYETTKQITHTAAAESDISWSNDGKALIYTSERDGIYRTYKATMARKEDPNFANATIINETPLFDLDGHERTMPKMSPDGKKLAFILDRNILAVKDLASCIVTELTDGTTYLHRDGRFNYTWSPDAGMIALEIIDRKHDPYTDIAIIDVNSGKMTNLTNSGYFDAQPRWALNGEALLFTSERYGMRNHASWGSMEDVFIIFLTQDAYDRFTLSKEDYEIIKEAEKEAKKAAEKDDKAKKDSKKPKGKDKADTNKADKLRVVFDGNCERIVRLTPMSSDLLDAITDKDGENLYYLISTDDGSQLWKLSLREDEHSLVTSLSDYGGVFDASADGSTIFIFGKTMRKIDSGDKLKSITYSASMTLDAAAEREYMFDNISREVRERFYVADMHGVDWPMMTAAYRKFLPYINNNYDFAEMVSEWLGELNVSHTGSRYRPAPSQNYSTAQLGLLYDLSYTGNGMRVAEVIKYGPFDTADSKVKPGVIIEKINGIAITPEADMASLLVDAADKKTLVTIYNPTTDSRSEQVVKPISNRRMSDLLYRRWVKGRAAAVDSLSNGRLGYVHIESMDDESFRRVYSDLLGKYNDREGIVIDVRWNGGGRLHEDIEVLFSGHKYFTQEIRGKESCDMPSRRWNKPSIMIIAEPCYSNAHGTPWVYKNRGLGKLVGMPVPGTMTSVNWVTMQDNTMIYGIPVIGYRLPDGSFLENQQLEPDIKVANLPSDIIAGRDAQLEAAVAELLKEIDAAKQ